MSYPVYSVPAGDVLPIMFDTFAGSTGASVTMSGLAVTDIEIYRDGGTTQRASDAGYTLLDTDGIDFDGITGIHGFSIDTGDNTDAGFYTVGAWYHVIVSSITVDGQTVNFVAAAFRIMAAEGVAGVPDVNTTHISDTAQTANDVGADVDAILVDTGTTLQAELDGIQADTEDIQAQIGAAGAGLSAIPWNAAWDAEVQSEVADALDADIPAVPTAGSINDVLNDLDARLPGSGTLSTLTTAAVNAEVVDALATDTYAEPGVGAPAATATLAAKINYLYKAWRNRTTQTASAYTLYGDDATTAHQAATLTSDGTTADRGEIGSG